MPCSRAQGTVNTLISILNAIQNRRLLTKKRKRAKIPSEFDIKKVYRLEALTSLRYTFIHGNLPMPAFSLSYIYISFYLNAPRPPYSTDIIFKFLLNYSKGIWIITTTPSIFMLYSPSLLNRISSLGYTNYFFWINSLRHW